jgi:WD40 repeat protein
MTIASAQQRRLLPPEAEGTLYLAPRAFSAAECAGWIASTEARGYAATGANYPADYRDNDRLLFDDPQLARELYTRLVDQLPRELEREGARWRLIGLNQRFRCCRYGGGQRFAIHRDGPYAPGPGQRSWLTAMLYLNDAANFEGGHTVFYTDRSGEQELVSLRPEQGDLVVFSHDLWHAGQAVTSGRKYVLRTDVLYERLSESAPAELPGARAVLRGHQSYVWSVVPLPEGRLASAGRDGTVRIWSEEGAALQVLRGPWRSLTSLAVTPGGLWAGRRDGGLQRFDLDSEGAYQRALDLESLTGAGPILALAPLESGGVLAACAEGQLTWIGAQGQRRRRVAAHAGWAWALAPSAAGGWVSGGDDGVVRSWTGEGEPLGVVSGCEFDAPVRALAALPPEQVGGPSRLAVGTAAGEVWVVTGGEARALGRHAGIVRALQALPGGGLASGGEDDRVRLWDLGRGSEGGAPLAQGDFVTSLALLGGVLVSASYDGTLALWPLPGC